MPHVRFLFPHVSFLPNSPALCPLFFASIFVRYTALPFLFLHTSCASSRMFFIILFSLFCPATIHHLLPPPCCMAQSVKLNHQHFLGNVLHQVKPIKSCYYLSPISNTFFHIRQVTFLLYTLNTRSKLLLPRQVLNSGHYTSRHFRQEIKQLPAVHKIKLSQCNQ